MHVPFYTMSLVKRQSDVEVHQEVDNSLRNNYVDTHFSLATVFNYACYTLIIISCCIALSAFIPYSAVLLSFLVFFILFYKVGNLIRRDLN